MQNGKARYTYLVGAAKSGTTKLADLLDLHPDVSLAKGKEPDTFAINEVNESISNTDSPNPSTEESIIDKEFFFLQCPVKFKSIQYKSMHKYLKNKLTMYFRLPNYSLCIFSFLDHIIMEVTNWKFSFNIYSSNI